MADDDQDDSQKTEDPTAKKLEDSRKKGQVPMSRELNNWVMLLAGTIVVVAMGGFVMSEVSNLLRNLIEASAYTHIEAGGNDAKTLMGILFFDVLGILWAPMLFFVVAAFLAPFVQIGPLFAPESIKPELSKISPIQGFKRIFSLRSVMEFVKGVIKIALIAGVATMILYPYLTGIEHFIQLSPLMILEEFGLIFFKMMAGILAVFFVVAILDVFYQRFEHYKKMRMSRQDIKDEYKQTEGDPMIKGKLRQLRMQRARGRMMQSVPEADVVITNPTHYSVALKYNPDEMDAPVVVAKGINEVALRIRELAKEHDIVIHEEPPLARAIYDNVEIEESIPAEYFKAVAKIISYVFKLKGML
jgi:flagellar biosynthetic protein FlhB